ncbi:MAG TPA: response regulator transcription factor [Thermoanaerobaculia bacterium]|jgi:DNA-binding NarL/FixJ family response regulator
MKIVIADDHSLFRESLRTLLEARGHEVIGEAANGREAVVRAREKKPDLVLMDLAMPVLDGLSAIKILAAENPEIKVVALTASEDDHSLFDAIKSGAQGYIIKNLEADEFFGLLEAVGRGEPALTPTLARKLLREFAKPGQSKDSPDALTDRELDVLRCLVDGITSNRRLAEKLGVSENTVKFHVRNILDKLHLHNRAQAVSFALRHRIVDATDA